MYAVVVICRFGRYSTYEYSTPYRHYYLLVQCLSIEIAPLLGYRVGKAYMGFKHVTCIHVISMKGVRLDASGAKGRCRITYGVVFTHMRGGTHPRTSSFVSGTAQPSALSSRQISPNATQRRSIFTNHTLAFRNRKVI